MICFAKDVQWWNSEISDFVQRPPEECQWDMFSVGFLWIDQESEPNKSIPYSDMNTCVSPLTKDT